MENAFSMEKLEKPKNRKKKQKQNFNKIKNL